MRTAIFVDVSRRFRITRGFPSQEGSHHKGDPVTRRFPSQGGSSPRGFPSQESSRHKGVPHHKRRQTAEYDIEPYQCSVTPALRRPKLQLRSGPRLRPGAGAAREAARAAMNGGGRR